MEILINERTTSRNNMQSHEPTRTYGWLQRGLMMAGLFTILGNIPVSSHLLETKPDPTQKFEIALNKTPTENKFEEKTDTSEITSTTNANNTTLDSLAQQPQEQVFDDTQLEDSQELELPLRAIETYVGHVVDDAYSKWKTYHVKSYDNLTNIFHKINQQALLKPLQKDKKITKVLNKLGKGSIARAKSIDGKLSELVFTTNNNIDSFIVTKQGEKFEGEWKKNIFEVRQARASFTINNGLFFDGRKAGITDKVVKQIVKVFDWDIDFSHDVRIGDTVTAVYEEIFHDGDKVDSRHLLAAEFINKGRAHRAIRYTFANGKADYFTPDGREMKKAFIRTPVAHARVSSHFNPARFHPKLHKIRAHKGTDFSARTGTAIMATGNGKVKFIGRKGGYGRTVIIEHREGYTTLYAHMSKYQKGLKQGDTVIQGERIGYVGRSGLASGPHLHYEFRRNGKPVNPMTVALPNSMSLSARELKDYRSNAVNLVLQLNVLHRFVKADIEINSAFGG